MPFRVPKFLGEFNGKICSEWPQNASPTILPTREGGNPPLGLSPTWACGARFVSPALNSPPTLYIEIPTSILFENPGDVMIFHSIYFLDMRRQT